MKRSVAALLFAGAFVVAGGAAAPDATAPGESAFCPDEHPRMNKITAATVEIFRTSIATS